MEFAGHEVFSELSHLLNTISSINHRLNLYHPHSPAASNKTKLMWYANNTIRKHHRQKEVFLLLIELIALKL